MKPPFTIIGAGLLGASLAYILAKRGRDVLVVDDARTGRASSWNPGGINPLHGPGFPDVMASIYQQAFTHHCNSYDEIRNLSAIDFGWKIIHRLFLAKDDNDEKALKKTASYYNAMSGFSAIWMNQHDLVRWDARIGSSWVGGLMTYGNVRIDAEQYRLALLAAASRLGARIISKTVRRVTSKNNLITGIDWGDGNRDIAGLCIATGAWNAEKIEGWQSGYDLTTTPLIGDLLLVRECDQALSADISHGLTAIYQHNSDLYWIGGTARDNAVSGESNDQVRRQLVSGARELMEAWHAYEIVAQSSAVRPVTKDGLPLLGRASLYENAWILNGTGGKGVLLCGWMAQSLAQMIETGSCSPEALILSPSRHVAAS